MVSLTTTKFKTKFLAFAVSIQLGWLLLPQDAGGSDVTCEAQSSLMSFIYRLAGEKVYQENCVQTNLQLKARIDDIYRKSNQADREYRTDFNATIDPPNSRNQSRHMVVQPRPAKSSQTETTGYATAPGYQTKTGN